MAESLTSLLEQARELTTDTLRRFEDRLQDVITEGEAAPVYQELERLLAETLRAIDERSAQEIPKWPAQGGRPSRG